MIIDTHCHLIDEAFAADVDEVISNALNNDVQKIILACCDEKEYPLIVQLCNKYPDILYPTIGIHPENMKEDVNAQMNNLISMIGAPSDVVAVGEIGIDLHWDKSRLKDQLWLLEQQIDWAVEHDLPVLLHIRDAMSEFIQLCKETLYPKAKAKGKQIRGILHCYSGTPEQAQEALQYGDFYFGIGGTITYKKSLVPEIALTIGLERIVLETDAPYLAPVPQRGRRNEPAYTAITCQFLADLMHKEVKEVTEMTTKNARTLFNI